jgi:cellulose synthase/poly-beta-1,6-N-acetylglucosamine synthase-like glycosyltransferase
LMWLMLIIVFDPKLLILIHILNAPHSMWLYYFTLGWINITWFYGIYHIVTYFFSISYKQHKQIDMLSHSDQSHVAILYTVCNDFNEAAAQSCLNQNYENCTVFVLDDSSLADEIEKVNIFYHGNRERCRVIRRPVKNGFKAGNVNYALRNFAKDYDYFAIIDSDEIIQADFISKLMPFFNGNPKIGFVQANHRYTKNVSLFAEDMSDSIELHWSHFLYPRNRFGFVMFYGHGAIIRKEAWENVGGFPEIVSEDIAFTTLIREAGYFGVFQKDVIALESFPSSYSRFIRREIKVAKGTLEFIQIFLNSFVKSKQISLTEKIDLLLSTSSIYLPFIFLVYLLSLNVILPIATLMAFPAKYRAASAYLFTSPDIGATVALNLKYWTWGFYFVTVITIFSPLIYQLRLFKKPLRLIQYIFQSSAIFISAIPAICYGIAHYLFCRKIEFVPTEDKSKKKDSKKLVALISFILGVVLFIFSFITSNIALLTIALSFILYLYFIKDKWKNSYARLASFIPFLFFVGIFVSIPMLGLGLAGTMVFALPAKH